MAAIRFEDSGSYSDEEALGALLDSPSREQPPLPSTRRVSKALLVGCAIVFVGVAAWRIATPAPIRHTVLSSHPRVQEKFFSISSIKAMFGWGTSAADAKDSEDDLNDNSAVDLEEVSAADQGRRQMVVEKNLDNLFQSHMAKKGRTESYEQQKDRSSPEACASQAQEVFHNVVWEIGVADELETDELEAFRKRFASAMAAGCKDTMDEDAWLAQAGKELQRQKPVMTGTLAQSLNEANLGFKVKMQDWLLHETPATFEHRLGLKPNKKGQQSVLKRSNASRQAVSLPAAFRAEDKWPMCKNEILRIHNQGHCGSCWAFGGLASIDARMCIASNGTWNGADDVLSRLHVTSCAPSQYHPGADGCQGGWPHWPMEMMGQHGGVVSSSCLPYYISGEGSEHFQQQDTAPPCETHCQQGYSLSKSQDTFTSSGVQNYDWLVHVHGDAEKMSAMKTAMYTEGPVAFAFFANHAFMGYSSGVFNVCTGHDRANHAVYAFGWGVLDAVEFVEASNSWGPQWGANGHFRISPRCVTDVTIPGTIEKEIVSHSVGTIDSTVPPDADNEYWPWAKPDECPFESGCVTDLEGAANYKDNELCVSNALNGKKIKVVRFDTEYQYDIVTINGHAFSGNETRGMHIGSLNGLTVNEGGIKFTSDGSVSKGGFKLCEA